MATTLHDLWVERYRPQTVKEYIWTDNHQKSQVLNWIKDKKIPHLMLHGPAGTGKTSLAKMLLKELQVAKGDILELNASKENRIEDIRVKVSNFASTMPLGECKYILLDECDRLTMAAQQTLKNDMEQFSLYTRFILTTNYPHKIESPIKDRCVCFKIEQVDKDLFLERAVQVLIQEGVDLSTDEAINHVKQYVDVTYPSMRSCLKTLQQNVIGGKLNPPSNAAGNGDSEIKLMCIALFQERQFTEAREYVVKNIRYDQYEDFYRFLYENPHYWSDDPSTQMAVIVKIAQGLRHHAAVADVEINLAATLIELQMMVS